MQRVKILKKLEYEIMKKRIITFVLLAAVSAFGAVSCQKTYQMVAPPSVSEQDESLDDEDFWGDKSKKIFVTPYGDGEMDGSSWEDAADADSFIALLSDQTDLSSTDIYVAEGVYYMSVGTVFGPSVRKDIRSVNGGYSISSTGTDISVRDTGLYETVFSGDLNRSGSADEGDCGLLSVYGGHSSFNGITFRHGYVSEQTASAKKSGAGVYVSGSPDTWAEFISCKFEGCVSAATTTSYSGGPAFHIVSGQARLKDCELRGCSGVSRGGAIRCAGTSAVLFLDRCAVHSNAVSTDWGAGLQISDGTACINNSTFCSNNTGNAGNGGEVNGGGAMLILNSTAISDDNTAAVRCESNADKASFIANSLCLNINGAPGFLLNGNSKVAVSGGHNIFNKVTGSLTVAASDLIYGGELSDFGSLEGGVYLWDASKASVSAYATASEIEGYAKNFSPAICPGIGEVFASWCGGFAVDQRGSARNPSKLLPGAYDPKLEGEAASAIRFSASVSPLGDDAVSGKIPDEFGFALANSSGSWSYVKKIVRNGEEYCASDGEMMLWDLSGAASLVVAYAPYSEMVDGVVKVSCPENQSSRTNLEAADFLFCAGTVNPATDLVDGKVSLDFAHLNTRLRVQLTVDGAAADREKITSLSVGGLKNCGECLAGDGLPAVSAVGTAVSMFPFNGESGYELITVPQKVAAGSFSVKITYDRRQYVWTSASEVSLEAGKTAEVSVNLVTTKSGAACEDSIIIR